MSLIHSTAIIDKSSNIHPDAEIGPFCVIGPDAVIEENVKLLSNVVIQGKTTICSGTKVWPFTVLGGDPQDLKFKGEKGSLKIGSNNNIREHVTMHIGTEAGGLETKVGDNNLFMAGAHIAHDCDLALLEVEDEAPFAGLKYLDFGGVPALESQVRAIGYPVGGDRISVTRGVVSRIDFRPYASTSVGDAKNSAQSIIICDYNEGVMLHTY